MLSCNCDEKCLKYKPLNCCADVQVRREEVKELIREDMLDEMVDKYLTESDTIWLLDLPAVSVSVDSEEAEAVRSVDARTQQS